MDEKDEEEIVVITVIMRYDRLVYLRLIVINIDKYVHHSRIR
jgi:hypothetical protein